MAILLTGGLGYIGSHIASLLGKKAVIIDNQSNSRLNYRKKLPLSRVYTLDLNLKNLKNILSKHDIRGVIHLAGLKAVNESTLLPLKYYRNNIISSLELLECMDLFKINKLIFSSSATVYGNSHQSPLKEDYYLDSTNPYASTKIIIEQMIKDYASKNSKFGAISLRYFNPIGANLKKNLYDQPTNEPQNIMPILLKSLKNKKIFKIYGNDYETKDGTCIRDYIHIDDLAQAHKLAFQKLRKFRGYDVINLGLGRGISVLEFIKIFEKVNNIKIPYRITKRRPGDVAISFADNTKAKNLLNWEPVKSYSDMMFDSWKSIIS